MDFMDDMDFMDSMDKYPTQAQARVLEN